MRVARVVFMMFAAFNSANSQNKVHLGTGSRYSGNNKLTAPTAEPTVQPTISYDTDNQTKNNTFGYEKKTLVIDTPIVLGSQQQTARLDLSKLGNQNQNFTHVLFEEVSGELFCQASPIDPFHYFGCDASKECVTQCLVDQTYGDVQDILVPNVFDTNLRQDPDNLACFIENKIAERYLPPLKFKNPYTLSAKSLLNVAFCRALDGTIFDFYLSGQVSFKVSLQGIKKVPEFFDRSKDLSFEIGSKVWVDLHEFFSNPDSVKLTFEIKNLPEYLNFDPSTLIIEGKIPNNAEPIDELEVEVKDNQDLTQDWSLSFKVSDTESAPKTDPKNVANNDDLWTIDGEKDILSIFLLVGMPLVVCLCCLCLYVIANKE